MLNNDVLERLRIDPGRRTLGELLQDREAAAHEIARLRSHIERLQAVGARTTPERTTKVASSAARDPVEKKSPFRAGTLIRVTDVCELLRVSASTVYKWRSDGAFPEPVKIGPRAVRWRIDDIEAWRDACRAEPRRIQFRDGDR